MNVLSHCEEIICSSVQNKTVENHLSFLVFSLFSWWPTPSCLCVWIALGFSTCGWPSMTSASPIRKERSSVPSAPGRKSENISRCKKTPRCWMKGMNQHCCHYPFYIIYILLKPGWLLLWGPGTRDTRCSVIKSFSKQKRNCEVAFQLNST